MFVCTYACMQESMYVCMFVFFVFFVSMFVWLYACRFVGM